MKKPFRILAGLAIFGFVLIVAMAVILPIVIQSKDLKPQIVKVIKQYTGRVLSIEGDLDLAVFPRVSLILGRTELSNAAGFSNKPFASMDAVSIRIALLPLLSKRVEMDKIIVEGLSLNLQRNKESQTNWDDFSEGGDRKISQKSPSLDHKAGVEFEALYIGGIDIRDAHINWQDDTTGDSYQISEFNLSSGVIRLDQPVGIDFSTRFSSQQHQAKGMFKFAGNILYSEATQNIIMDNMVLNADAKVGRVIPGKASLDITSERVVFDIKGRKLEPGRFAMVLDFDLSNPMLKGVAEVQVDAALDLNVGRYSLSNLLVEVDANGEPLNNKQAGLKLESSALTVDLDTSESLRLNGQFNIAEFNARQLLETLGQSVPETADPIAFTRIKADFDFAASGQHISMNRLNIAMDDTTLKGRADVTDFNQQAVTFDLDIDKIDLDRYLPSREAESDVQPQPTGADVTGDELLFPVVTLRKLNANGMMRIASLKVNNIKADDISLELKSKDGHVNLKPQARLYQGQYSGDFTVNVQPKVPVVKIKSGFNNIQIEPLLKDLMGEARLAGTTRGVVEVNGKGNSQNALKKTLNGDASFNFNDGAIVGINIGKILRQGIAKLKGKAVQQTGAPEKTDFSQLSGKATIENGVVASKDFSMKSPLLRASGDGTVDLPRERVDYLLEVSLVGSLQGQGGEELSKLKGVTIPLRIEGPFSDLSYKPDLSAVLSDRARKKVQEKKDELQDKLKGRLKGLF